MKILREQRGVTLISLVVAVTVILIITNVTIYNVKGNLSIQNLKALQNDISNLRDKVSEYYAENGRIPTEAEYTDSVNLNQLLSAELLSQEDKDGDFYVIKLSSLENLTLSYGEDYEKIKNGEATTQSEINQLDDIYIINNISHNIFYVRGITVDGETFYTDYTADDVDKVPVNYPDV